ncbi:ABC transporter ATP-binding protein [Anaerosphaera multitolerans]|uniref:ABC transporter ATP-binding protein n=1 Tax=Anaerosphaera multitolerans TaxID=2487351 RepID=A0A437S8V0_9FIRM|nr:ABC transporter ATP-binding protein [Anaerosphaera multitolerans]RVU55530.1 ABC transporter ATP-binding protein [Anaerosphaera multitolerans]
MKNLLKVENLSVAFPFDTGDKKAVIDMNFELHEHDFVGLVGESGCGKSVAAQTIMGLQHPKAIIKSGSIELMEEEIIHSSPEKWQQLRGRKISMIFQEPMNSLNPLMKVGRQIEEVLEIHFDFSKERRKEIVVDTMKKVGLRNTEEIYEWYPHELSGGMQQRIMIAMALVANPRVLIADEPTTAIDATIQTQILKLFKDIEDLYRGAVLFISHDLKLVSKICKRIMVMYAGRIIEEGDINAIINTPKHPYTKGLLKAIPDYKKRGQPLYNIPGQVTPLKDRIEIGCPFYKRCESRMKICREVFPKTSDFGNQKVCCHLYDN